MQLWDTGSWDSPAGLSPSAHWFPSFPCLTSPPHISASWDCIPHNLESWATGLFLRELKLGLIPSPSSLLPSPASGLSHLHSPQALSLLSSLQFIPHTCHQSHLCKICFIHFHDFADVPLLPSRVLSIVFQALCFSSTHLSSIPLNHDSRSPCAKTLLTCPSRLCLSTCSFPCLECSFLSWSLRTLLLIQKDPPQKSPPLWSLPRPP